MRCPACHADFPPGTSHCPTDGRALLGRLAAVVARGPLPLSQVARITAGVSDALAASHARGEVHGAVIPEHVYFRHVGSEFDLMLELPERSVTPPAATYATPERVAGNVSTPESDVYQLGVMLFHQCVGFPPFEAERADDVLRAHLSAAPPPLSQSELQEVPERLDDLVKRMLAKSPSDRPDVVEIARTLREMDLDSTVLGVSLSRAREIAQEFAGMPTRLDSDVEDSVIPEGVPVLHDAVKSPLPDFAPSAAARTDSKLKTDPVIADPFADTFIRDRSEVLAVTEPADPAGDGTAPTMLNLEAAQMPMDETRPSWMSSKIVFAAGVGLLVGAIAVFAFMLMQRTS